MTTNQVIVTTSATQIVAANAGRSVCLITPVGDVYLGASGVAAWTGFLAKAGISYPIESQSAIYGITASGSSVVTYMDMSISGFPVGIIN
jgi:hypothetical protein